MAAVIVAPEARYTSILACPACQGPLAAHPDGRRCLACGETYGAVGEAAQLDLRLRRSRDVTTRYSPVNPGYLLDPAIGRPIAPAAAPACAAWEEIPLAPGLVYGNRLTRTLLSHFPAAKDPDDWMLDLGCGDRRFEPLCRELTGFHYVGIDFDGTDADLLADAHALPFQDAAFSFILSVAVLEHLAAPAVAMAEVMRVLKPGGVFLGTVAFLEPFHMFSHYHMTHVGLTRLLDDAGFEIVAIEANDRWTGLRAQAEMALFPGLGGGLQRAMVALPQYASEGLGAAKRTIRRRPGYQPIDHLATTGGFRFVARRPPAG